MDSSQVSIPFVDKVNTGIRAIKEQLLSLTLLDKNPRSHTTSNASTTDTQWLQVHQPLPPRRHTDADKNIPRQFSPTPSITASDKARPPLLGSTVLLVDDNNINQLVGSHMLSTLGCLVLVAHDGDDAISQLKVCAGTCSTSHSSKEYCHRPWHLSRANSTGSSRLKKASPHDRVDLILMDYHMPIKDGITATREIRAMEANHEFDQVHARVAHHSCRRPWKAKIPILAYTTEASDELKQEFIDAGADGFIEKPPTVAKLRQSCEGVLVHCRMEEKRQVDTRSTNTTRPSSPVRQMASR